MERSWCVGYIVMLLLAAVACSLLEEPCEQEGEVRLSGGASPLEGRVDWCRNGFWGAICDHIGGSTNKSWTYLEARVVCRQLGRQLGVDIFTGISRGLLSTFRFNREPIMVLQNQAIVCSGDEESLADCPTFNELIRVGACYSPTSTVGVTCVPSNSTLLRVCSEELQDYQFRSVPFACPQPVNGDDLCLVNERQTHSFYNEFVCNGVTECGDCSDECHCFDMGRYGSNRRQVNLCRNSGRNITVCNCSSDEFQCANGFCVPSDWRCDGQNGCGDNSDEISGFCKELRAQQRQELQNKVTLTIGISCGLVIALAVMTALVPVLCFLLPCCPMRKLYTAMPTLMVAQVGVAERGTEDAAEEIDSSPDESAAPLVTST